MNIENQANLSLILDLKTEVNPMLIIESRITEVSGQLDYPSRNDELNRLLSAAVVS